MENEEKINVRMHVKRQNDEKKFRQT